MSRKLERDWRNLPFEPPARGVSIAEVAGIAFFFLVAFGGVLLSMIGAPAAIIYVILKATGVI